MITSRQLAQALLAMASDGPSDTRKLITLFVNFLKENNLQALAPNIVRHLEIEKKRAEAENRFTITSAYKLNGSAVNNILKAFKSESGAEVEKSVDESLIGGIVVKHNGVMYDASVKAQLSKLQELLTN
jgi:F-type H+-transporting ATPase subunit delta